MSLQHVGGDRAPCRSLKAARPGTVVPVLSTPRAMLREVQVADATVLCQTLAVDAVQRYLPTGPDTPDGFARFIRWVRRERRAGRYMCFAVVPHASGTAAGLFQIWPIEPGYRTAEFGFALAPSLWGTGMFAACAAAIVDFAVDGLGVKRLECRSAVGNERGARALARLHAVQEGTLRSCFTCPAGDLDHIMWSILAWEWRAWRRTAAAQFAS